MNKPPEKFDLKTNTAKIGHLIHEQIAKTGD